MKSLLTRIGDHLALRRSIVGMLLMVILVGAGEKMVDRFVPVYLVALGAGPLVIGLLGGLQNLIGAAYSLPGGYLSEHLGYRAALLLFNGLALAGFLLAAMVTWWPAVLAASLLFLAWSAVVQPATMDLVSQNLPQQRRVMGVSLLSLIRRVPMALGPLLGGVLLDRFGETTGMRVGFVVAAGMTAVGILFQQMLITQKAGAAAPQKPEHPWRLLRQMSPGLRKLLVSDILIRFCEQIPNALVVLWCTKTIAAPVTATQFGALTAIEMATAALCYIPVAHFADRAGKKPFVVATFVFFTLFPLTLLVAHSFWPLVGAFMVRGLKEFGEPTRKALILELCPEERRASMFGLYYLVRDSIVSIAALGGGFLWAISPTANLLTAFAFGVVGTIWFAAAREVRVASSE